MYLLKCVWNTLFTHVIDDLIKIAIYKFHSYSVCAIKFKLLDLYSPFFIKVNVHIYANPTTKFLLSFMCGQGLQAVSKQTGLLHTERKVQLTSLHRANLYQTPSGP